MQPVPAIEPIKHFPCMLYHRAKQPIVVKTKREQDEAFVQGYSMSPSGITQEEMLLKKKVELVAEIAEIDESLAMLRGGVEPEDEPEPVNMLKGIEGGIPVEETPVQAAAALTALSPEELRKQKRNESLRLARAAQRAKRDAQKAS